MGLLFDDDDDGWEVNDRLSFTSQPSLIVHVLTVALLLCYFAILLHCYFDALLLMMMIRRWQPKTVGKANDSLCLHCGSTD